MKIVLLGIGKTSDAQMSALTDKYAMRASHMAPFAMRWLPDVRTTKGTTAVQQKEAEGKMLLQVFKPGDMVVLLDEHGKEYTSREFSAYLAELTGKVRDNIYFVIGGPYGFSPDVYKRANAKISLSKMTFPHELVRLFFAEQIYRALTIMRGMPYHHD